MQVHVIGASIKGITNRIIRRGFNVNIEIVNHMLLLLLLLLLLF